MASTQSDFFEFLGLFTQPHSPIYNSVAGGLSLELEYGVRALWIICCALMLLPGGRAMVKGYDHLMSLFWHFVAGRRCGRVVAYVAGSGMALAQSSL